MDLDNELIECFKEEAQDYLSDWEKVCLALRPKSNELVDQLNTLFRCAHNLKGASRSLGFNQFGEAVHSIEDLISFVKSDVNQLNDQIIQYLTSSQSLLDEWVEELGQNEQSFIDQIPKIKEDVKKLMESTNSEEPILTSQDLEAAKTPKDLTSDGQHQDETENSQIQHKQPETIRLNTQKLDQLIKLIGELSINQSILSAQIKADNVSESTSRVFQQTDKVTKEIQEIALKLRMGTMEKLFQRLKRTSFDISHELNKEIDVQISGEACELDRVAISSLTEPLIHIVRNAVDHGIEKKEQRLTSGKPHVATLKLEAKNTAHGLEILISDDGQGLNIEKITKKAIENGLINSSDKLTDQEAAQLIFRAGFSTADKVTDVSGRGVGMDVVKKSIESVNGHVTVLSTPGQGTVFRIRLPLSLNVINSLHVGLEKQRLLIPLNEVSEVVTISSDINSRNMQEENVFCLREHNMPFYNLSSLIGERNKESFAEAAIILEGSKGKIAIGVDKVLGQSTVFLKEVSSPPKACQKYISGATVLQDGFPGVIINTRHLLEIVERQKECG